MASDAIIRFPNHNHRLSKLYDVDDQQKASGKTLVWNSSTGKHVYEEMGVPIPVGGTINRIDGMISSIDLASGVTVSIIRDGNDRISQIDNETYLWTFNRDGDGTIISWTVT